MAKPNYLRDHLFDPKFASPVSGILVRPDSTRLRYGFNETAGSWQDVAAIINKPICAGVAWFPDANVAILDDAEPVWNALRGVALRIPGGATVINGVIAAELKDWLDAPYRNKERAQAIRDGIQNKTWIRTFDVAPSDSLFTGLFGYAHLLGFRRMLARDFGDGKTIIGTNALDKAGTMNAIRNRFGPRAVRLAKKGREDLEKHGKVFVNDEFHCLLTIAHALRTRRTSVILTADEDFREVFFKAQYLLDTHYRAWLVAQLISEGRYGQPSGELADAKPLFEGPVTLYRRNSTLLHEVLPWRAEPVSVIVVYVAPDKRLHRQLFNFEVPMLGMIETRSRTDGRCTDLLGDRNVHVHLGPLMTKLNDGMVIGVGCDHVYRFQTNETTVSVSLLDIQHAVACVEGH